MTQRGIKLYCRIGRDSHHPHFSRHLKLSTVASSLFDRGTSVVLGQARCTYKGGLKYTGTMLNGEFHGKGLLVFGKKGGSYEGAFRLGRQVSLLPVKLHSTRPLGHTSLSFCPRCRKWRCAPRACKRGTATSHEPPPATPLPEHRAIFTSYDDPRRHMIETNNDNM